MDDGEVRERRAYYKYVDKSGGGAGFAYLLGMIGSAVYWVQQGTSLGQDIIGLLKALIWPAFLIYHLLQFIHG